MAPADRNLDESPLPHRFVRDIMSIDAVLSKSPLMIVSSKGCFDRCAFCTITRFYSNTWRGRSPKHVVDELEFIVRRYDRRSIHFWDDTFIGPGSRGRNRAIEFAAEVRRRNLDITFHVTTRPSDLREDVIAALAAAGMRSIFIGVESADQAVLDYFGKHAKVDHATAAIELLWKHGVHRILAGFILFHPRMTFESLRRDLDYLDSFPTVEISRIISRLSYYPGAQFWLENKAQLGPNSYKRYVMPPLADERLERLYRSCLAFHSHTVSIEGIFVCLEEQYLHDTAVIDIIAACRRRLFRLISARVRVVADGIEQGRRDDEKEVRFREEIYRETLEVIDTLVNEIGGAYLELILKAYRLENHAKFLRVPRAARRKKARGRGRISARSRRRLDTAAEMSGRALVLLSGGIDSAVVAVMAAQQNAYVHFLSFDYGQANRKELACARRIARALAKGGGRRSTTLQLDFSPHAKIAALRPPSRRWQDEAPSLWLLCAGTESDLPRACRISRRGRRDRQDLHRLEPAGCGRHAFAGRRRRSAARRLSRCEPGVHRCGGERAQRRAEVRRPRPHRGASPGDAQVRGHSTRPRQRARFPLDLELLRGRTPGLRNLSGLPVKAPEFSLGGPCRPDPL